MSVPWALFSGATDLNISFTTHQRHTLGRGLMVFAIAVAFVALALAAGSMPSGFAVRAEALIAFAQGALGA